MGIKIQNKEKKNNKKKVENRKIDEITFVRIKDKFQEYWKILFLLIGIYIICYLVWFFASEWIRDFAAEKEWNGNVLGLVICLAAFQGLLFSLDGVVTSLLKSPFNQMCYAINKAEGISDKKKDYIITKATESNEHCKETLKKFGIITIVGELAKVFIKVNKFEKHTKYENLMVISYLVPLLFAIISIVLISRELEKIKKNVAFSSYGKEKQRN